MISIAETPPVSVAWRVPAALVGLCVAAGFAVVWLLLPPTGSDLSAQVAHADFAGANLWNPVDMRWFGGATWISYSVLVPPLMAAIGVRLVGALGTVAAAGLLGLLLGRCAVPRPRAGAVAGALCLSANLLVGRLTFTVGVAAALVTILATTSAQPLKWLVLIVGPLLTWAASPLAALFLGLVGACLVVRRQSRAEGLVIGAAALAALAASVWLGQGGVMPAPVDRGVEAIVACAVVAWVTPYRPVRVGALLAAAGLALSLTVHTQIGMNAIRLPALFAAPIAVACSRARKRVLVPAVALVVGLVPPLTADDLTAIGEPSNDPAFYSQLIAELDGLPLTGRVEIPPTLQRWEAVYVAAGIPLARGWMTQLDDGYNPLFFSGSITATAYRNWLRDNAVQYVAVPDAEVAEAGSAEVTLITAGLPYLHELWRDAHWTVYSVDDPTATVTGATVVSQNAAAVVFRVPAAGKVTVRVRYSQWLTLTGPDACLRGDGAWTQVVVNRPGTYRLGSALLPGAQHPGCSGA